MNRLKNVLLHILCILCISMSAMTAMAQDAKVNINIHDATLKSLLKTIEKKTNYHFSYNSADISRVQHITLRVTNTSVSSILDRVLAKTGLTYYMMSSEIIAISTQVKEANSKAIETSDISGKILDENGEPAIGATVAVSGTNNVAVTNADGEFHLNNVKKGDKLNVTYFGYDQTQVKVKNFSPINLSLSPSASNLNELVVIGYGATERKRVTTAISTVKGEDLLQGVGGSTIATAIKSKIPGLVIDCTNNPNGVPVFQLRGVASVKGSSGPLIVIDGIPGGDLRSINQEDIESIDVLKDASAGAIYGTRAAGGVIIVTTHNGKSGRVKATFTNEFSIDHLRKRPEMLTAEEYITEFVDNGYGANYGYATNWYDEMINDNAFSHKHTLTLTGGSDKANVYASLMYGDDNGIIKKNSRTDYSGRINANFNLFKKHLELNIRMQVRRSTRENFGSNSGLYTAMQANPTIPLMDPDNPGQYNVDNYGLTGTNTSPVADIMYRDGRTTDQWITGIGTLKYHVIKGLDLIGTANIDLRESRTWLWWDPLHRSMRDTSKNGKGSQSFGRDRYNSYEAYASYKLDFFDRHHLDAVAGWSFNENHGDSFEASNSDFTVEGIGPWNIGEGGDLKEGLASMASSKDTRQRLIAFFGRVNYSYDDKYLFMASFRREGSSKFGPEHRFGNFWAVSGGWRINRESWLKDVTWLNDLKIRLGYGVTGNNGIPAGIYTPVVGYYGDFPVNGEWIHAYGTGASFNQSIKWEEKTEFNAGLDFSLFNGRLWGRFDWYRRKVNDLVYSALVPLPDYMYDHCYKNIGALSNTGWELELGGTILQTHGFKWNTALRLSGNKSKISRLGDEGSYMDSSALPAPGSPGSVMRISAQSNIGQYWLYRFAGLSDEGKWMIYDKDNNIVPANSTYLKAENRVFMGNAIPKCMLSMDHSFSYRHFDLSLQFHSWLDFDIYNANAMYNGIRTKTGTNVLRDWYYDHKEIKDGDHVLTDYFLEDGSFLKIDAITLGYTLPMQKWTKDYLQSLRFYFTARDVACWTNYSGYNPEVTATGLFPGTELPNIGYPMAARFTFGIQMNF